VANSSSGHQKRPGGSSQKRTAPRKGAPPPQPRPTMPRWLKYTLAGLILFTLTLRTGPLIPVLVCAFALGLGVWQLWQRRARMWWTGAMFLAVGLYVLGLFLVRRYEPLWFFYFAAWIFVIVSVVAEGGSSMEQRKAARLG
jgi:hypothetical protein